ncbi:MAG TPA: alpha-hydroxy acid oxidase [Candidatus Limnocylindrales bacterium]|nr:alpha-hydroxy acid oxidase [Candidatus Limnocylindrales bacterium]
MTGVGALDGIVTLRELEPLARARMDPAAWDYVAGGAWDERSLLENDAAWSRYRLLPRVLVDVSRVDPATTLLGRSVAMPVAIAPMAAHALAHADAEAATARAAASAGVPFILSTMSSRSIEAVAQAAPDGDRLFQLYVQRDPAASRGLVERAAAAGYRAIVLTVDLPVLGYRERDLRNSWQLDVPLGNFAAGSPSHADHGHGARGESGYEALEQQREVGLAWDDVETIRGWSGLPIVLKGILRPDDARRAVEHGADGIVVSNHGARQLDRTPAPIDVLGEIVEAVGDRAEIWVDGGVRRGLDVVTALALGARGVLVGRPVLWGLTAGGETGAARVLEILREELVTAMTLLGAPTPAEVSRDLVRPAGDFGR